MFFIIFSVFLRLARRMQIGKKSYKKINMNDTKENWGFILLMITLSIILSWVSSGSNQDYVSTLLDSLR